MCRRFDSVPVHARGVIEEVTPFVVFVPALPTIFNLETTIRHVLPGRTPPLFPALDSSIHHRTIP